MLAPIFSSAVSYKNREYYTNSKQRSERDVNSNCLVLTWPLNSELTVRSCRFVLCWMDCRWGAWCKLRGMEGCRGLFSWKNCSLIMVAHSVEHQWTTQIPSQSPLSPVSRVCSRKNLTPKFGDCIKPTRLTCLKTCPPLLVNDWMNVTIF